MSAADQQVPGHTNVDAAPRAAQAGSLLHPWMPPLDFVGFF
jgi:hypothetical protein